MNRPELLKNPRDRDRIEVAVDGALGAAIVLVIVLRLYGLVPDSWAWAVGLGAAVWVGAHLMETGAKRWRDRR